MQVRKLAEHVAIFGVQTLYKSWIAQLDLAFGFAQIAQRMQPLQNRLTPLRRQLLPAREQSLADLLLLRGSHLLPHALPFPQILLLPGSQTVPRLETLANPRLLLRRKILESLVITQELLLPFRRHILEPLYGLRRQVFRVRAAGSGAGAHGILPLFGPHLTLFASLLRGLLGNCSESFRERRCAHQPCHQQGSQNRAELGAQPHYLVSFVTSPLAAAGATGNSESASNLESTS